MILGTGQNYNLGFTIYLRDQFSGPVSRVSAALDGLKGEYDAYVSNLKAARNTFAGLAAAGGMATKAMAGWIKTGAEYDDMMTISRIVTRATTEEMEDLHQLAKQLASTTIFFPQDIASGIRFMGMAGQDAKTILETLTAAVNLTATQPGLPLGGKMGGADILTNILKGFNLEASHSTHLADMLTEASTSANITVTDLGHALKYVAATASDLQFPVQDVIAFAMALGNAGIQGSMAGTALENSMRYLTFAVGERATAGQKGALAAMGLSSEDFQDAHGNLIPMVQIFEKMRANLKGMGTVQVQNILKEIFGVRGKRFGSIGVRMLDDIISFNKMLDQSSGRAAQVMDERMKELQGSILKVRSAWLVFKTDFTEAVKPWVIPTLDFFRGLIEVLQKLIRSPIGKWMARFTMVMVPAVTISLALRAAAAALALTWKLSLVNLTQMTSAVNAATRAMLGLGAAKNAANVPLSAMVGMGTSYRPGENEQVKYSQKRGMFYVTSPDTKGATWLPKEEIRYSKKRDMHYAVGPKGTRWLPKGTTPNIAPGAVTNPATRLGGMFGLRALGGMLGKFFGFMLGPWGIATMMLISFIPGITRLFSRNNRTQEEIRDLLKPTEQDRISSLFSDREFYEAIKNKTFEEMKIILESSHEILVRTYGAARAHEMALDKNIVELVRLYMTHNTKEYVPLAIKSE